MRLTHHVAAVVAILSSALLVAACTQAAPAATPTTAAAKAAEPTKAPAQATAPAAAPTKPAAAQPTAAKPAEPTKPAAAPTKTVDFPAKGRPITILNPWAAGGGNDLTCRLVGAFMEKDLGVPVQVLNKPGASSQVGTTEFVQAKPDGYTILLASMPTASLTYLDAERKAVYTRKDFQPIANLVLETGSIAVKTGSKYDTLKDLFDAAKANPGKIKIGHTGFNNTLLDVLAIQKATGVDFAHVQFDGSAPQVTAMLGDNIDTISSSAGAYASFQKSGQVKILGLMAEKRSKFYPDSPTFKEQGYDIVSNSTRGFAAPAGTPKEIMNILEGSLKKALADPEVQKKIDDMMLEIRFQGQAEFSAHWDSDDARAAKLLENFKIN